MRYSRLHAEGPNRFNAIFVLAIMAVSCPLYGSDITLQDNALSISFDSDSGALTRFENKNPHWVIERRPEFGVSFRLYAPLPTRRYNPVFGQKQHVADIKKVSDNEICMRWDNLVSENGGVLPMSFAADVTLTNGVLTFGSTLKNDSDLTVETVEYPYFGDLNPPSGDSSLTAYTMTKGALKPDELYPHFHNEKGYWGVTWPTKMLEPQNSHFCAIQAPDMRLNIAAEADYRVQYIFEQHPGVISGVTALVPPEDEISGIPVHLEFRVCHFVFAGPHSTTTLAPVILKRYQGDWHAGQDSPASN
ncbi:MAG TPA: hypothetical protein VGY56_16760 [Verrucomicrobiae bacterium]|nr:hypothetical protein [Verrucomicrobiae bacterium]